MAAAESREEAPPAAAAVAPLLAFKHSGKPKKLSEAARENKRRRDQQRDKSRVTLHRLYPRWRELRDRLGFSMDTELAELLMDSYEKRTEAPSPPRPAPHSPSPPSGPHSDQCPYCGFVLPQWCLQNRIIPKEVPRPQSVRVKQEPKEEPVSDAEEAGVQSFVLKGENEGSGTDEKNEGVNSDEDSESPPTLTATNNSSVKSSAAEESERNEDGAEDWIPPWTHSWTVAAAEESEDEEKEEESEGSGQNSDDDWTPPQKHVPAPTKAEDKPTPKPSTEEESGDSEHRPGKRKLCSECGMFYRKKPHECEHKTKPFVCNICGKRCVSESYLKLHYGIHLETYEHACKYCYANFKTRVDKLAHELIHQEQDDPYRCPDCALTFPTFKGRAEHTKQHRDENPFRCAICGTVFGDRPAFLRHMVVHTGERAFKCSVCGRGFSQASHLKSHMRLHTGERPYSCKLCHRSFNHNVSLKSHVRRYHPAQGEESWSEAPGAEAEADRRQQRGAAARSKCRRPLTGRPRGRPKRDAAKSRKPSRAAQDSSSGSSEYDFTMFYM